MQKPIKPMMPRAAMPNPRAALAKALTEKAKTDDKQLNQSNLAKALGKKVKKN